MHGMNSATRIVELEITSGQALHKRRLVEGSVLLIGTCPECDLVIAADGVPEVCAIVTVRSDAVVIRDVAEEPTITVNGQTVGLAQLADGDKLRIGPFAFTIHIRPARAATPPVVRAQHALTAHRWIHGGEPVDMAAMSAATRLRADIQAAMAKHPRTLRRPA